VAQIDKRSFLEFQATELKHTANITKNRYLNIMSTFCSWLVMRDVIRDNPLRKAEKLNEHKTAEKGVLTPEQFTTLITSTEQLDIPRDGTQAIDRAMFYLLAGNTGLRRSELLRIYWKQVNFKESMIYMPPEQTKNKVEAVIPLNAAMVEALRIYDKKTDSKQKIRLFDNLSIHIRTAELLKADLEAASLPTEDWVGNKIVFHSLRNSFITFLANRNIPAKIIQALARHSNPELTMNIYARAYDSSIKDALDKLPKQH